MESLYTVTDELLIRVMIGGVVSILLTVAVVDHVFTPASL